MAVTRSSISLKSFSQKLGVGKTRPKITTSMFDNGPGTTSGSSVSDEAAQLQDIKQSLQKLLILEKQHYDELGDKILKFSRQEERDRLRKKEEDAEAKKPDKKQSAKSNPFVKGITKGLDGFVSFFGDLFKWFIGYKIVEWVSKPENLKKVQNFSKLFLGIIKFVSNVVGFGVDKLLDGLDKIVNGDGVSKVFGVLEAVVGFFTLKWLANPLKIISDIKGIASLFTKTIPNTINSVINFFSNLIPTAATQAVESSVKEAFKGSDAWAKNFPKEAAAQAAKQGSAGAAEQAAKTGGTAAAGAAAKGATKGAAKISGKTLLKKIPIIGAVAGGAFAIDRASKGDWLGAGLELASGGASLVPGWGTAASLGIDAALIARDIQKESQLPKLAKGGIVTKPTKAIVGEAGPEAIVPLDKLSSFGGKGFAKDVDKQIPEFMKLLTFPFKIVGAAIVGMMVTSLSSIPGIGPFIMPLVTNIASRFGVPKIVLGTLGNFKSAAGKGLQTGSSEISKLFGTKTPVIKTGTKNKYTPSGDKSVRGLLANILNLLINKNSPESTNSTKSSSDSGSPSETPTDTSAGTPSGDTPKIGGSTKPLPQNATLAKAGDLTVQNMAGTEADLLSKGYRYVPNTGNRFWQDSQGRLYEATRTRNNTSLATMMGVGEDVYKLKAVTQDQIDKGFTSPGNERITGSRSNAQIERDLSLFRIINKGGNLEKQILDTLTQIREDGKWKTKTPGGGAVGGFGTGDKIPALLEPGEYVLNRNAVGGMGGPGVLDHINFKSYPRFQGGGRVPEGMKLMTSGGGLTRLTYPVKFSSLRQHHGERDQNRKYGITKDYILDGPSYPNYKVLTPVAATVAFAGSNPGGYGNMVELTDDKGRPLALFGHFSRLMVKTGQKISAGTVLGIQGNSGKSTGPHVHIDASRQFHEAWSNFMLGKSTSLSASNLISGTQKPGEDQTTEDSGIIDAVKGAEIAKLLGSLYKGLTGKGTTPPATGTQPASPGDKITSPGHTNRGPSSSPAPTPSRSTSAQSLSSAQSKNNTVTSQVAKAKPTENIIDLGTQNNTVFETSTQPIASTLGGTIKNNPLVLYPIAV